MRVNKAMLMIRLINRITAERNYWRAKVETGVLVLYRMIESPLNSMYISK